MIGVFALNLWRWKCGLPELNPSQLNDMCELQKTEWSDDFISKMKSRMILGAYRYGKLQNSKYNFDRYKAALKRLRKYEETGNREYLIDAANFLMIEFMYPMHIKSHFKPIDDGEHA